MTTGQLERRVVSVLFADLVGFTALSEGLDAEEVSAVQVHYFAAVRDVIGRYGGRLEKFIGDAAMAVFGVPRARDDDAERAVRAGLALVRAVEALPARIGLGEGSLELRVGVNSGEVAYAPSDEGNWRVSGDTVNVAARLQTSAQPGTVLVGDVTALAVADIIAFDPPLEIDLKGKSEAVRAWRAVTPLPQRSRERAMGSLRAPLLGREREAAELEARLDRVRGGASETLIVVAPPGVGKTRLVEDLAERAARAVGGRATSVLRARLGPDAGSVAVAVTQLLVSAGAPGLPESGGETAVAGVSELDNERSSRFRRWIDGLDAEADGHPSVWLIEDVHWSGGDLLAFIEQAGRQPADHGRLILCTARPSLLDQLGDRPMDVPPLPLLELEPLTSGNAGQLVGALVGDALPPPLVTAVVERSDGNPLFIEELLRWWVSSGLLLPDGRGGWQLSDADPDVAMPQSMQAVYAAQLDDLPDDARTLMRRASVVGRRLPRDSIETLDVPGAHEALEDSRRRALVTDVEPDAIFGATLAYRHALLRDAGYASLARAERARLHARLARWYERTAGVRSPDVAEQIAGHYAAAVENSSRLSGQIDEQTDVDAGRALAMTWFERAASNALAAAAHESARRLLRRAFDHAGAALLLDRARLLLRLGEATAYTADMDEGAGLIEQAVELYRTALRGQEGSAAETSRAGYAEAAAALGRVWIQQLRFAAAGDLADQVLTEIGAPDDAGVARLLCVRGWMQSTLTNDRASVNDVDRALAIARRTGDRALELEALDWRARVLGELDMAAPADLTAVEQLARELGDSARELRSMRSRAGLLLDDDAREALVVADRAEEQTRRRGSEEDMAWLDYLRAEAGFVSGNWERAIEAGLRAVEMGERNAYHRVTVRTWHVLLPIAEARGDRALLERAHGWYTARAGSFPDSPYARIMEGAAAVHRMRAGLLAPAPLDIESRLSSYDGEPGGPSWLHALETVLQNWLEAGEVTAAAGAADRLRQAVERHPDTSSLGRGVTLLLQARVLAAQGSPPATTSHVARLAIDHFRHSDAPFWIAKALGMGVEAGVASDAEGEELAAIGARLELAGRV